MAMTQHKNRFVQRYEIDTLGAPFKVILIDCVRLGVDAVSGNEKINVPDVVGLISAVVRARVSHPRKLNGDEIRFVRNALGIKANQIAKFLGMSPEHFSRCESAAKVMAVPSEKMFRLFAFLATHYPDPKEMLLEIINGQSNLAAPEVKGCPKKTDAVAMKFVEQFLTIKIESAYDTSKELCFEFNRKMGSVENEIPSPNDEAWETGAQRLTAACG